MPKAWITQVSRLDFYLAKGKMKEGNMEVLHANIDIFTVGLEVCHVFELKGNLTDSTIWNTGETGDIY